MYSVWAGGYAETPLSAGNLTSLFLKFTKNEKVILVSIITSVNK